MSAGAIFTACVQFDFMHGPPSIGDPSVSGHRDEPLTDRERQTGQRYMPMTRPYGGGYLGLPQTGTQAKPDPDAAPLEPKEAHLITPGKPHVPGLVAGGREEFEFQH